MNATPGQYGGGQAGCTGDEAPNCKCTIYCDYLTDACCSLRPRVIHLGAVGGGADGQPGRGHVVTHLSQNGNGFIPIYNIKGSDTKIYVPGGDRGHWRVLRQCPGQLGCC